MTELDLYHSQLAHFDKKPFEELTSLKELELKHNQLSYLDKKNFEGLESHQKFISMAIRCSMAQWDLFF